MLNGCQGSGKTTLSDYLCTALREDYGLGAVALSLDDFYLTRAERKILADGLPSAQSNQLMDDKALAGFIQHFERLTRYCLEHLPPRVNHLYLLDEKRQITAYTRNSDTSFSR